MAKGGGGALILLVGLFLLMSRGTAAIIPDVSGIFDGGSGGLPSLALEEAPGDPLSAFAARKTSFKSKATGVISPGTFSGGVVRRKGVLKQIIRKLPRGGTKRLIE